MEILKPLLVSYKSIKASPADLRLISSLIFCQLGVEFCKLKCLKGINYPSARHDFIRSITPPRDPLLLLVINDL